MTDRELLELTAKAVGLDANLELNGTYSLWNEEFDCIQSVWNPLEDDGDALRLAVKLHMFDAGLFMAFRFEETRKDPSKNDYEITRRAIVLAAAEIGKGIK